jgi:hypothetical protein
MQNKFAEVNPRNFNSISVLGLSDEARKAVNAALYAMSTWRIETANNNEKNGGQVIEKLAAAARALGWPEQIVDATGPPSAMLSKLKSFPSISPAGTWANADALQTAAINPIQFWTQVAEQWQKAWADAMSHWIKAGKPE